jgi:hypothetical protein
MENGVLKVLGERWRKIAFRSLSSQFMENIAYMALVKSIAEKEQIIHCWVSAGKRQFMPFPNVILAVCDKASVMLYRYRWDGEFCGDTWHSSLNEAQNQAEYEYGAALGPWLLLPSEVTNPHEYVVAVARKNEGTTD